LRNSRWFKVQKASRTDGVLFLKIEGIIKDIIRKLSGSLGGSISSRIRNANHKHFFVASRSNQSAVILLLQATTTIPRIRETDAPGRILILSFSLTAANAEASAVIILVEGPMVAMFGMCITLAAEEMVRTVFPASLSSKESISSEEMPSREYTPFVPHVSSQRHPLFSASGGSSPSGIPLR
jgi:hypothetical protein